MHLPNKIKILLNEILKVLYPKKCVSCGEIIDEDEFLCDQCFHSIESVDHTKHCRACGFDKKNCLCSYRVFRFAGIVSAFLNESIAQKAYYAYKFGHKMHYGQFFAERMSLSVVKGYHGIKFDYICAVPTSLRSKMKRGFDHSDIICNFMSSILKIPKLDNALVCKSFVKPQHTSDFKLRMKNVKGKYSFTRKISGGRILLVDDIMTTGATLDECARQLLLAGADEVYCVTALYTVPKKVEIKKDM